MNDWQQVRIHVPAEDAEAVSEALEAAGALSITYQDGADQPLFEPAPGETPLWRETQVIGLFPGARDTREVIQAVEATLGRPLSWEAHPLPDRDWTLAWTDHIRPMRFGDDLWVVPEGQRPPEAGTLLRLTPGLAFGTGTHPTTALCLEWLARHRQRLQGARVVDYGCGSGILAIAAALLGAERVWAIDIDPQALSATRDNAAANGVEPRIRPQRPNAPLPQDAHVLLANILANPLMELAPRFADLLQTEGHAILSGLLEPQAEEVERIYRTHGFAIVRREIQEGWVRLDLRRE